MILAYGESGTRFCGVGITGFAIFSYNVLERDHYGVALLEEAVLPPDTSTAEEEDED